VTRASRCSGQPWPDRADRPGRVLERAGLRGYGPWVVGTVGTADRRSGGLALGWWDRFGLWMGRDRGCNRCPGKDSLRWLTRMRALPCRSSYPPMGWGRLNVRTGCGCATCFERPRTGSTPLAYASTGRAACSLQPPHWSSSLHSGERPAAAWRCSWARVRHATCSYRSGRANWSWSASTSMSNRCCRCCAATDASTCSH